MGRFIIFPLLFFLSQATLVEGSEWLNKLRSMVVLSASESYISYTSGLRGYKNETVVSFPSLAFGHSNGSFKRLDIKEVSLSTQENYIVAGWEISPGIRLLFGGGEKKIRTNIFDFEKAKNIDEEWIPTEAKEYTGYEGTILFVGSESIETTLDENAKRWAIGKMSVGKLQPDEVLTMEVRVHGGITLFSIVGIIVNLDFTKLISISETFDDIIGGMWHLGWGFGVGITF